MGGTKVVVFERGVRAWGSSAKRENVIFFSHSNTHPFIFFSTKVVVVVVIVVINIISYIYIYIYHFVILVRIHKKSPVSSVMAVMILN